MAVRDRIRKVKHLQNKNFICVLEHPRDIVNIASAIRNISAFGVEKLYVIGDNSVVSDFETSRNHKRLGKMSVGANRWVFVRQFDTAAECVEHLRKNQFTIAVTSPHVKDKQNVCLYEGTFTPKRLAVWFGNESAGVSDEAVANADLCIEIPMGGIVESLNLGTSTGIILSFISDQRLRFVFEHSKVRFKPRGRQRQKMRSWSDFINPR